VYEIDSLVTLASNANSINTI